jgi:protein-disulfide isomerase
VSEVNIKFGKAIAAMFQITALLLLSVAAQSKMATDDTPAITGAQASEILAELRAIRQLLEKTSASPSKSAGLPDQPVEMSTRDLPGIGDANAPITVVEFTDYQCPYCRRFHQTAFEEIKKNLIDTGKVRFLSRDLPLSIHDNSAQAANAARCAGDQNKFWEMRHEMLVNPQKLARDELVVHAQDLHLDLGLFAACLDQRKHEATVQRDAALAAQLGITGTPSFLIGPTVKDGRFKGLKVIGAQPYEVFEQKIRSISD